MVPKELNSKWNSWKYVNDADQSDGGLKVNTHWRPQDAGQFDGGL